MQAAPQKAYVVYEKHQEYDDGVVLVFAASATQARRKVWAGECSSEVLADAYIDLRARREPWADAYADTETVPASALLAHGWGLGCADCGRFVWHDDLGGMTADARPLCRACAERSR